MHHSSALGLWISPLRRGSSGAYLSACSMRLTTGDGRGGEGQPQLEGALLCSVTLPAVDHVCVVDGRNLHG